MSIRLLAGCLPAWCLLATLAPAQGVQGTLFLDADRDGVQDPGEHALAGVTVTLFGQGGNTDQSTTSAADGSFAFSVPTGYPYVLGVTPPAGMRLAYQDIGGDPHPIPDWPKGRRRPGTLLQMVPNLRAATAALPFLHAGLGDSIAFGFNLCDSIGGGNGYLAPLTARLDQASAGAVLAKLAVVGYETRDLLDPGNTGTVYDAAGLSADLVSISIGGNDYLNNDGNEALTAANLVAARQNLQEILSTLVSQLPNGETILNTVYDNEGGANAFHNRWGPIWNQMLRDVAFGQRRPVGIAEVWPDYDHQDPATGANLGQKGLICDFFGFDTIHPTKDGYDLHEEKVWQGLGGVTVTNPTHTRNFGYLPLLESRLPTTWQDVGGGAQNEGNVLVEDGVGARVPAGNQELRVAGFDATPRGLLRTVVLRVKYRTTAPPADDYYRFEASVDGTFSAPGSTSSTWNTIVPIVGGAGNGVPVLAWPDQPLWREVSASVTLGAPIDGSPSLTWQDLATLTVRCKGTAVGGADAFDVEWDVADVELYGVPQYTLLVLSDGVQGSPIRFDVTGTQGSFEWTFASVGTGSLPFPPWGTFGIDLGSFWTVFKGTIGNTGAHTVTGTIPVNPALSGLTVYFQSWVVDDLPTKQGSLTNVAEVTVQ